jgi:predicted MFS family arabinose efflux permease
VYALLTVTCMVGAVCFFLARYDFVKPRARPFSLAQLFGGFGFLWRERALFGVISLDLFAVMLASVTALLPVFAKDVLQVDAWGLGLLRAAPAVGAVLVSIALARWSIRRRAGKLMLGNVALFSVALLGFAFSGNLWLSLLLLAISGGADMVSVFIRSSLVPLVTPDEKRGRVSAVENVFIGASNELGAFESGAVSSAVGAPATIIGGGIATVVVAGAWWLAFPSLRDVNRFEELEESKN